MRRCDAGTFAEDLDDFPVIRDAMRNVAKDLIGK